jgi:hypothetical protein
VDELQRLTVCNADPTAPHAHQYGTPAAITAHRCVGRELVRGAAPGRPLCAATGCGRCPSAGAAIIYESIHSGALNGSVDSDGAVYSRILLVCVAFS